MKRIKKGDEVIVITGKVENKGKRGIVQQVLGDRVVVGGINLVTKHVKPNPHMGRDGGVERKEAPLHISNVMLYDAESGKGSRVGFRFEEGKKVRFFKSSGKTIS